MFPRRFALIGGIVMLAMGLMALVPQFVGSAEGLPLLKLDTSYGMFLNLFPMNILNKAALIIFGLAGIIAAYRPATSLPASIAYSRWVLYVMGSAAILGLIPATSTLFGYWPLFGNEIAVHAFFAILGAYFGYALPSKVEERPAHRNINAPLARSMK